MSDQNTWVKSDQTTWVKSDQATWATIGVARVEKKIPDAYRLVRFRADEGQVHLKLQGYFTWNQGFKFGGEWNDIETVDADDLSDDKPYGPLT